MNGRNGGRGRGRKRRRRKEEEEMEERRCLRGGKVEIRPVTAVVTVE